MTSNSQMPLPVRLVSEMAFSGNVIPHSWFSRLKLPSGPPDIIAILILAEIVYWYRWIEVREELSGQVIERRKKFAGDKLQRGYESLALQFGFSMQQVKRACYRLKAAGLITVEHRTVTLGDGRGVPNTTFFEVVPEALRRLTFGSDSVSAASPPSSSPSRADGKLFETAPPPVPSASEPSPKPRTAKRAPDETMTNPAVVRYRDLFKTTPALPVREEIVNTVADIDLWDKSMRAVVLCGFYHSNVSMMLKTYKNGGEVPPRNNTNQQEKQTYAAYPTGSSGNGDSKPWDYTKSKFNIRPI